MYTVGKKWRVIIIYISFDMNNNFCVHTHREKYIMVSYANDKKLDMFGYSIYYGFWCDDNGEVTERNKLLICFTPIAYRISHVSGVIKVFNMVNWYTANPLY